MGNIRSRFAVSKTDPLYTVCYYKIAGRWYLDAPEYLEKGGNPDTLERIGSFHDLLEMAAEGESSVVFQMDAQPFEGSESCHLVGYSGGNSGGYYRIRRFLGQELDVDIWFNTFVFYDTLSLPPTITLSGSRRRKTNCLRSACFSQENKPSVQETIPGR